MCSCRFLALGQSTIGLCAETQWQHALPKLRARVLRVVAGDWRAGWFCRDCGSIHCSLDAEHTHFLLTLHRFVLSWLFSFHFTQCRFACEIFACSISLLACLSCYCFANLLLPLSFLHCDAWCFVCLCRRSTCGCTLFAARLS